MPGTNIALGVQLYTLRDAVARDFSGTAAQLAEIGYAGVELAGYGNLQSAPEVKKALDDAGLKVIAAHVGLDQLERQLDRVLEEQHSLNSPTIVVPWLPEHRRGDAAAWKRAAQALNVVGAACRDRGIELCYHHHSFEFQRFEGRRTGMDILLEQTEPALVKFELDVYWLKHGGEEPVAFIERLGGRAPLVHLKDMAAGAERRFAPVGEGVLNWRSILSAMKRVGARWGIVEQDDCYDQTPIESVRSSYLHLRRTLTS